MYQRNLMIAKLLEKKSFFFFGPRQTGKTTLITMQLPSVVRFDLLDSETFATVVKRPKVIEELTRPESLVVIDEIQKCPGLLDEVQRLITQRNQTFLLTGSSARKLRRGGANLLAGRAWQAELFPLTFPEIPDFDLETMLTRGGLPHVYPSSDYREELSAYVGTYLKEEIQAEALTRNVRAFAEFLDLVALSNGFEINYESLASDLQVSATTVRTYFQILEDTLIGFRLPAYTKTRKRKAISRAKHYLFDLGVTGQLIRRGPVTFGSESFGKAFEHFIILEVRAFVSYSRLQMGLTYWRSLSQFEVDLILGESCAIEVKSTQLVSDKHIKGLRALKEENLMRRYIVVSLDQNKRVTEDGIEIWPWRDFLVSLWAREFA